MREPNQYLTPAATLVYPSLFEPSAFGTEEPVYSATFLIPKVNDLQPLKEVIKQAAASKWGTQILKNMGSLRYPVRDGDEKAETPDSFYAGMYFVRAKSKWQPPIVDIYNEPITEPSELYGGCVVRAVLTVYGYDYMGNRGIGCGLRAIVKIDDGEPIGSGMIDTSEAFKGILKQKKEIDFNSKEYNEIGQQNESRVGHELNQEEDIPF